MASLILSCVTTQSTVVRLSFVRKFDRSAAELSGGALSRFITGFIPLVLRGLSFIFAILIEVYLDIADGSDSY